MTKEYCCRKIRRRITKKSREDRAAVGERGCEEAEELGVQNEGDISATEKDTPLPSR